METKISEMCFKPFDMIGNEWLLIAAEKDSKVNTMTASWGGFGVIWNKNVVYVFIRQSRYTKEFVDFADTFSVNVFEHEKNKEMLAYMGKVSGRDEDKIAKCNLTVEHNEETPYFAEARQAFLCKKLYSVDMPLDNLADKAIIERFYGDGDIHTMYVGEIIGTVGK